MAATDDIAGEGVRVELNRPFTSDWGFCSDVAKTIPGATSYIVAGCGERFATGRRKLMCRFFDAEQRLVDSRVCMELTSKKTGKPYHVVWRHVASPELTRKVRVLTDPKPAAYNVTDLYE